MGADPHLRRARVRRLVQRTPEMAAGALAVVVAAVFLFQLTWNGTASLPVGIYRVRALAGSPERGDVVGFCLEGAVARLALARGYVHRQGLEPYVYAVRCAAGVGVVGKPVAGVPGDTVEVRREGVWINGVRLVGSGVRERDRAGRALPHPRWGRRVLGPGEFWLQSTWSARSFDSRYYGPVRRGQIRDRRRAILVKRSG